MHLPQRSLKDHASKATKYILIGGFATLVYLAGVYILTDIANIYYVLSSILAFTNSTLIGYAGHKYITFRNFKKEHKKQLAIFFAFAVIGMVTNVTIVYFFVDVLGLWYMLGAVVGSGTSFVINYLLNYFVTFRQ